MHGLRAAIEWQSRAVVGRHLRVYLKNWHTSFLPPVLEPITLLLAFGLGLGAYMARGIEWNGRDVGYMDYIAPGMLAYATFMTAIFQSLFGAFIRTLSAHLGRSADDADRAAARGVGRDPVGRPLDDELRRDRRARALGLPGDRPAAARARISARDHPDRVRRRLCVRRPGPVLTALVP